MVELDDLQEGILPTDCHHSSIKSADRLTLSFSTSKTPCVKAKFHPSQKNMGALSSLANSLELTCGILKKTVLGGNSANTG